MNRLPTAKTYATYLNAYNSSVMQSSTHSSTTNRLRITPLFWVAIALLALTYLYLRLNVIYSARYSLVTWHHRPHWADVLYNLRWPMRIITVGALVLLAWLEYASGSAYIALQSMLRKRRLTIFLVLLTGAISGSYYLQPGSINATADGRLYVAWAALLRDYFRLPEVPLWANAAALGIPLGQYYNLLSFAPAAIVGLLIPNMQVATNLALYALHILAVWGIYLYIEKLTGSRAAGLTSAFAQGFAFYLYHKLVLVGLMPMVLTVFLMPWQFYYGECIVRKTRCHHAWSLAALTTALSIAGHLAYGLAAAGMFFLNLLIRGFFLTRNESLVIRIRNWLLTLASPMIGIIAAGIFVVPPLTDANSPIVGFIQRQFYALDLIRISQVFTFAGSYLTPHMWGGYLGVSVGLLAGIGASLSVYRWRGQMLGLIAVALLSLWLVLGPYYAPFFQALHRMLPFGELIYGMHTPGYYIIYLGFSLVALTGVAVHALAAESAVIRLLNNAQRWLPANSNYPRTDQVVTLCGIAMLAIAIDLVPLTLLANAFEPPRYARPETGRERAILWLQNHGDSALRVHEPNNRSLLDIYQHTGMQQTAGIWDDRAPSMPFAEAIAGKEMLYLANVGYIITPDALPVEQQSIPGQSHLLINPSHSMLLASTKTEIVDKISASHIPSGIDQDRNTAETIYIIEAIERRHRQAGTTRLEAKTNSYNWGLQTTTITYELTNPAFVQLSISYYPHQTVLLDGQAIHTIPTGLGLIGFWSDDGQHHVRVEPRLSSTRVRWMAISLTTIIALTLVALMPMRNHPTT